MIEFLTSIDETILLAINGFHFDWLDPIMKALSGRFFWIPLYVLMAVMLIRQYGWKRGFICIAAIGMAVGMVDIISHEVFKPMVHRLRPANLDNPLSAQIHIVDGIRGGRYGFPSNHAANCSCLASFLIVYLRKRWVAWLLIAFVALNCYSRMYLGVHYPLDILAGLVYGTSIGLGTAWAVSRSRELKPAMRLAPPRLPLILNVWKFRITI